VGRVSSVTFDRPGFFADVELSVKPERSWSQQLPGFSAECMDRVPSTRLDTVTRNAWFSYSGCPYADAANMTRFGSDYPDDFLDGFRGAFVDHLPADLTAEDWLYLGRVLDMFALSSLVTEGHPVAGQAAREIRRWVAHGVPDSP
jgi:hypothetical protein